MTERMYTIKDLARAWAEGAETAWSNTHEEWNGEYARGYGLHDRCVSFAEANDDIPNPYEQEEK